MFPYTTYLIDLDGVIYRGEKLLPGASEFIAWLVTNHKKYLFLTNNSFATKPQILEKLEHMGIVIDPTLLLTAAQAAVQNIAHRFPGGLVYLVGDPPIAELLQEYGLNVAAIEAQKADAVLVGLDRSFTYQKLTCAMRAIRSGAAFVSMNRDPALPVADGFLPGCGTMAAAIEVGSGVNPEVVGKPEPMLLQEAMQLLQSTPDETLMIGDSLDIDILAGKAAGTHTLLVLSGHSTRDDLEKSSFKPDYVYQDIAEVLKII